MSRWKRHSDEGLRLADQEPSIVISTRSSGCRVLGGMPDGVTRKPPSVRRLILPDDPRVSPRLSISSAASIIAWRGFIGLAPDRDPPVPPAKRRTRRAR